MVKFAGIDPGTSGQVLTSNGPSASPTFQNAGGGGSSTVSYASIASDIVVTNQATQNAISFTAVANKTYVVTVYVDYLATATSCATAATFSLPSGSMRMQIVSNTTTTNATSGDTAGTYYGPTSTTNLNGIITISALIRVGSTGGTVTLSLKKNSATAGTLTWYAGSSMVINQTN